MRFREGFGEGQGNSSPHHTYSTPHLLHTLEAKSLRIPNYRPRGTAMPRAATGGGL